MKSILYYIILLVATASTICLSTACDGSAGQNAERIELRGEAQGTYYSIIYYDSLRRDFQSSIDSLLHDFDMTASLWEKESLLRQINDNRDSAANEILTDLLDKSVEMNRYTEGCFDCTVGKLVNAWGFGAKASTDITDRMIDSLKQYTGMQPSIVTDSQGLKWVRKPNSETEIDFNAIAQGYAADLIGDFLEARGIRNYIVDIGGEVCSKGCKPNGSPWLVGIERPADNRYSSPEIETTITLKDLAVVTSGNYRKYREENGLRYSHTIDPATGRPVGHTLLSVSVIDTAAWRADALATAFMVMGLEKALQFIEKHPNDSGTQAVFFIYSKDGEYRTYATEGFKKLNISQ